MSYKMGQRKVDTDYGPAMLLIVIAIVVVGMLLMIGVINQLTATITGAMGQLP